MESRSLETGINIRIFAALSVIILLFGSATVFTVRWKLYEFATKRAWRSTASISSLLNKDNEHPEAFANSANEIAHAFNLKGPRVRIRSPQGAWGTLPSPLSDLSPGKCMDGETKGGETLRACAAADGNLVIVAAVTLDGPREISIHLAQAIALILFFVWIGAYLALRASLRKPLRALDSLARWSDGIGEGESFFSEPPESRVGEVDRVAAAFRILVHRLVTAIERERRTRAYLAHELRTPLTAIKAEIEFLLNRSNCEGLGRLQRDVDRLADVVDSVVLLAEPKLQGMGSIVNVADVAREVATADVQVDAPDEALVHIEPALVRLAISNLLDNANRYATGGPRILRVARDGTGARLSVIDAGEGLDDLGRSSMFEPQWRGVQEPGGSGFGLAFVRAVALKYGGEADVRSGIEKGLDVGFSIGPILHWDSSPPTLDTN